MGCSGGRNPAGTATRGEGSGKGWGVGETTAQGAAQFEFGARRKLLGYSSDGWTSHLGYLLWRMGKRRKSKKRGTHKHKKLCVEKVRHVIAEQEKGKVKKCFVTNKIEILFFVKMLSIKLQPLLSSDQRPTQIISCLALFSTRTPVNFSRWRADLHGGLVARSRLRRRSCVKSSGSLCV